MRDFLAEYGIYNPVLPSIAGKYHGKGLVICGDAAGIWNDLEAFGCRCDEGRGSVKKQGFDFMAVNKIGEVFPGELEHWYSNSGDLVTQFKKNRRQELEFPAVYTHACTEGAEFYWPWSGHGTSGLGALVVGLWLGYDEIMLCGIPLEDGPHNGEPPWRKTNFSNEVKGNDRHWMRAAMYFAGRVSSMSGRTRMWFGN